MYLLDTNAFIIFMHDSLADGKLSIETKRTMLSEKKLYVSVISLWEISIKKNIGKLKLEGSIGELESQCRKQNIDIIPVKSMHLDRMLDLELMADHRDPFDRLILATALSEEMTLISTDEKMRRPEYGANVIW